VKALRCFPLFAGALALVVVAATANASTTAKSSSAHHTTSSAPGYSSTPAKTHASTAPADEHLAAIRQSIEQSRHNLRGYHWKETIAVDYQGELPW
jgi:hypothetical protein